MYFIFIKTHHARPLKIRGIGLQAKWTSTAAPVCALISKLPFDLKTTKVSGKRITSFMAKLTHYHLYKAEGVVVLCTCARLSSAHLKPSVLVAHSIRLFPIQPFFPKGYAI